MSTEHTPSNESILAAAFGVSVDTAEPTATEAAAPTENAAEQESLATEAELAEALQFVTLKRESTVINSGDVTKRDSVRRGIGSITLRSGGKLIAQRTEFAVAKMDEAHELRQQMIAEGRLIERPDFAQELADTINPTSVRAELRNHAQYSEDLAKLEQIPGTRSNYPHISNAKEDVAQTLLSLCRNPADAELIAAVASILPDYMRHQQKERHIMRVQDAQAAAVEAHVSKEMQQALKRLEFRSGLLASGGDAELAQDLAAWAKRGNKLSIKSNLSAAPHLIPLLQFNDAKELEQVFCEVAQYIPEHGYRFTAVVLCPDNRHKPEQAYKDPNEAPVGFSKAELIFSFTRIDASTVHIVLRERVLNASSWSPAADLNPFVTVGAWDVYGCERSAGEISPDTVKVQQQAQAEMNFLRAEAEHASAVFMFPALWEGMKAKADAL